MVRGSCHASHSASCNSSVRMEPPSMFTPLDVLELYSNVHEHQTTQLKKCCLSPWSLACTDAQGRAGRAIQKIPCVGPQYKLVSKELSARQPTAQGYATAPDCHPATHTQTAKGSSALLIACTLTNKHPLSLSHSLLGRCSCTPLVQVF